MRSPCTRFVLASVAVIAAAWSMRANAGDAIFEHGFDPGFRIQTPEIVTPPGEGGTWCYFFRAPDTGAMGIRKWTSSMDAPMHHLIVYATYDDEWMPLERRPAGTLVKGCVEHEDGYGAWLYAAHAPRERLVLPADDGGGIPLGMEIMPGQPLLLQMYVSNPTEAPVTTTATLQAEALSGAYTRTATYQTTNISIAIPPGVAAHTVTQTCAVPPGVRFWRLSTRTHRYAIESRIEDAGLPLVVTTDWNQPEVATFAPPDFHPFSPAGLTYSCTYANPTGSPIHFGESDETDEVCIAIGHFFPATRPSLCVNDVGPL